jgi:hypothetical protein
MPKFNVAVDHETERESAVVKLRNFSEKVLEGAPVELSDVEESWDAAGNLTFGFKAMGMKVTGTVVTCEQTVTIIGQLPFAAVPFRGQIEKQIEAKVKEALA